MAPKISVVIPCYNVDKYIVEALNSIINQTFQDWEIVLVDDCSKDRTLDIIKEFAAKDSRIRFIECRSNSGAAYYPRAEAVKASRGEWIHCVDADDYDSLDCMQKMIKRADETNADAIYPVAKFVTEDGKELPLQIPVVGFNYEQIVSGRDAFKMTIGGWQINANGCLVKRNIYLKSLADYKLDSAADTNTDEILTRVILLNSRIVAFTDAINYRRENPTSITRAISVKIYGVLKPYYQLIGIVREYFPEDKGMQVKTEFMLWKFLNGCAVSFETDKRHFSETQRQKIKELIHYYWERIDKDMMKNMSGLLGLNNWLLFKLKAKIISFLSQLKQIAKNFLNN